MTMGKIWRLLLFLGIACLTGRPGFACTSVFLSQGDQRIMAANMDWPTGDGMVVINKRGFSKTAVTDPRKQLKPAVWTSRYGSVTFNQYAVDWPWGGMNEAGLAGTAQIMRWTEYPQLDRRPSIFLLQWLQYQLDNFGSVREVLDHLPSILIRQVPNNKGAHFFLCDRGGDAAVVDFIDGRAVVYHGDDLPVKVMANDPYVSSLVYLEKFKGFGGTFPVPDSNLSKDRFVRAAKGIITFASADPQPGVDFAFGLLDRVAYRSSRNTFTQWQVAFDLMHHRIYYRSRDNPRRRHIDMGRFEFGCSDPIQMRDISSDNADFSKFSYDRNYRLVRTFYTVYPFKRKETELRMDRISRYPDSFVCR